MSFFENIKMALISIFDNKLRSFLTMISIIIGIAAVIAIVSIGRGVSNNLVDTFLDMTKGSINVQYKPKDTEETDMYTYYPSEDEDTYTESQIEALKQLPLVKDVVVSNMEGGISISYLDNEEQGQQLSTIDRNETEQFEQVYTITRGKFFSDNDFEQRIPKLLIHEKSVEKLFGEKQDPIGKELIVNGKIFTVNGVYTEQSAPLGMSFGGFPTFFMPYNSWIAYKGYEEIQSIAVVPTDTTLLKETGLAIEKCLNDNKILDGTYSVVNLDTMVKQVEDQLGMMTMFITLIAAISLLVGGIGVMNIMYVSVVERTNEIGLRKALGASGTQVMWQFLIESVTVTSIGGLLGILLGLLGNLAGSALVGYPFTVYLDVIAVGFGFAAAIGLLFGTLPALKASKMQPIEALRSL